MNPKNPLTVLFLAAAVVVTTRSSALAVPTTMGFSARISDSAGPINSAVNVDIRLFDANANGNLLWEEDHPSTTADNGLVQLELGSIDPTNNGLDSSVFDGSEVWLEVVINGVAQAPRLRIGVVPYAIKAASADRLGTLTAGDFAASSHSHNANEITSGTLATSRFSAYSDLGAEGYLDNNANTDLLTRSQSDTRYRNASNLNAGTLSDSRYSCYSDLGAEGYLNNNSGNDLLTRSQADARYLNGSNWQTYVTPLAAIPSGGTTTVSAGSDWEVCMLHFTNISWGGSCQVRHNAGVWSLAATNASMTGSLAHCGMICLNLQ